LLFLSKQIEQPAHPHCHNDQDHDDDRTAEFGILFRYPVCVDQGLFCPLDIVLSIIKLKADPVDRLSVFLDDERELSKKFKQFVHRLLELEDLPVFGLYVADSVLYFAVGRAYHLLLHQFLGSFRVLTQLLKLVVTCVSVVKTEEPFQLSAHRVLEVTRGLRRLLHARFKFD